jgi:hypothetical protein
MPAALRTARPGEVNHGPIDIWTVGHVAVGAGLGLVRAPWWVALGGAVAWEFAENPLKRHVFNSMVGSTKDTFVNSTVDVVALMVGWGVARSLRRS